ncbi:MAG: metallophosphoesterase family protein [Thermoplasmata archaeon]|nr:metallophosphoesterase family protein [Thermoplasmata archaeon]MCI4362535.1 metallophosphoesterase family protein [Thermoplasmata archaeon]
MSGKPFRFAHLADAHVGAWSRDLAIRDALRESVLTALRTVRERDCDFLLVSGDLFHTPVPDPAEAAPVAAALKDLVDDGRRIYTIYGSHDYVAHRTSWLDVLAETGLFLRAAPEAVRAEGDRWTLPFLTDEETGARIAGISGRSHGLDRAYFLGVDSEAFRAAPGFKIFQFHAAIQEYLPDHLQAHIRGISVDDLPGGCDYYAGGHIHRSYSGRGPEGAGLLVNPGAVFGTSVTDVEDGLAGRSHRGLVIVDVTDGRPTVEWVRTTPTVPIKVLDVDVDGQSAATAQAEIAALVERESVPGAILFPRVHGTLSDGSLGSLGLGRWRAGASAAATVHWDLGDAQSANAQDVGVEGDETRLEGETFHRLSEDASITPVELAGATGERRLKELFEALGSARSEGEAKSDYERLRRSAAYRALGLEDEERT